MNLSNNLPSRMCCLLCFSPNACEKRLSKRGGAYFVCNLCNFRVFVNSDVHVFGLLFWSKTLSDPALTSAARSDLERALASRGTDPVLPRRDAVPVPATALPVVTAEPAKGV